MFVTKMEIGNKEQRVAIKFCNKLDEAALETCTKIVKAHGDSAQVCRWRKEFKEGMKAWKIGRGSSRK